VNTRVKDCNLRDAKFVRFLRDFTGLQEDQIEVIGEELVSGIQEDIEVYNLYTANIFPEMRGVDELLYAVATASVFDEKGISANVEKRRRVRSDETTAFSYLRPKSPAVSVAIRCFTQSSGLDVSWARYPDNYAERVDGLKGSTGFKEACAERYKALQNNVAQLQRCFSSCGSAKPAIGNPETEEGIHSRFVVQVRFNRNAQKELQDDPYRIEQLNAELQKSFGLISGGHTLARGRTLEISGEYLTIDREWQKVNLVELKQYLPSASSSRVNQAVLQDAIAGYKDLQRRSR